MYLKELMLRGFKSFASATTLRFEPGITAVVGPNGSGKSNIVDALTWVMGEQGARNLRGSSMEDVIFAGTATRPALGRAQVTLTIDNSDHALDVPYAEVTISRTVFRNGGSEYAINGSQCRLLDIQELLSDTGLGQQMHVIVGQGRLDSILRADPAGNRAFIEEAAGILKHRRRKDRALRKLAATQDNLARVDDLITEVRRQMGPLGRQARISRRADLVSAALRDAKSRVMADDAVRLSERVEGLRRSAGGTGRSLKDVTARLAALRGRIEQLEKLSTSANPDLARCEGDWRGLTQETQRLGSMIAVVEEREASLRSSKVADMGEDPDIIGQRAAELAQQAERMDGVVADRRLACDQIIERRAQEERRLASIRQTMEHVRRAAKERDARMAEIRELIAKEESAVQLARSRSQDLGARRTELSRRMEDLRSRVSQQRDDAGETLRDLERSLDDAREDLRRLKEALAQTQNRMRERESRAISLEAKAAALNDTLSSRGGDMESALDGHGASRGRLWDFLRVSPGWERAFDRVIGPWGRALVMDGSAAESLLVTVDVDGDYVVVVCPRPDADVALHDDGGPSLASRLSVNPECADVSLAESILATVAGMVADVACASDAQDAWRTTRNARWRMAVTADGLLVGKAGLMSGTSDGSSDMLLVAARDKAREDAKANRSEAGRFRREGESIQKRVGAAADLVETLREKLEESRLRIREQQRIAEESRKTLDEVGRQLLQIEEAYQACLDQEQLHKERVADAHRALAEADSDTVDGDGADAGTLAERERALDVALAGSRKEELDATLSWKDAARSCESLHRQAELLSDNAVRARRRREGIAARNADIDRTIGVLRRIAQDCESASSLARNAIDVVDGRRRSLHEDMDAHNERLRSLRAQRDALEPEVSSLGAKAHKIDLELQRAESDYDELSRRVADELGMGVDELVAGFGPDRPVPVLDDDGRPVRKSVEDGVDDADVGADVTGDDAGAYQTVAYNRAEQERRRDKAAKDLAALGRVNPLATEEYDALEERHRFLVSQRDDIAAGRADLMTLVSRIDSTMVDVFRSAFEDTAKAFEDVFATLFPGGHGRLRLDNPDDLLTTGVVVEASPAGKRVRQLSLLSGGERSLTALALLFAIFMARPSPFYVMDEVEAALDDVNLSRLLSAVSDLSKHAQLIIITHQQRTMGIADALYGVTMRSDGVTTVMSQRLEGFPERVSGEGPTSST
ncbi:chromosome segregation protein SMC [uncultured Bifidobacterium sp.]|uniref:chromosome segregation protein SMC n=1 Tax=uncultured Bifidobacterium sp. TaxID=165187 RepID=UPI002608CA05|nr:chromosome segregation protein SMC [uncultured Bifidobacterium sp.]